LGSVIRKDAAVEDILADCKTTLANAQAKGGVWKDRAEERILPVLTLFQSIEGQLDEAEQGLAPLLAAVRAKDADADAVLGKVSDEIWNLVGRPAADPALSVLFPGGIAYYADGDTDNQPDRMAVLSQLLLAGIHPKLPKDKAAAAAAEVTASAETLHTAVDAARQPAAKLAALQRIRTSVARVAQIELTNLKRTYKASGYSEAEIHEVLPDRPVKTAKAAPKAPAGDSPAPLPAAQPGGAPPA